VQRSAQAEEAFVLLNPLSALPGTKLKTTFQSLLFFLCVENRKSLATYFNFNGLINTPAVASSPEEVAQTLSLHARAQCAL
jgi:hypothetical protein